MTRRLACAYGELLGIVIRQKEKEFAWRKSRAMRYVCPFCLDEGSTPASIKHHVDCPYLVAGFDLSLFGSTAILIVLA